VIEVGDKRPESIARLQALAAALQPGEPVRTGLSILGYLITAGVIALIALASTGFGHDVAIWDRVGDQVRAGVSPYGLQYDPNEVFLYTPVWAVIFAAVSWLPPAVLTIGLIVLEVAAWRVCAGSWRRVGYLGLFPIFGFDIAVGQINLLIAAAVALALRGDGRLAVIAAFAKISPALAIREWRRPLIVAAICLLVTLPVLSLWRDWIDQLVAATQIVDAPVPYWVRLAVAGGLLMTRRTWARGLAVIVAIPNPTANVYVLLAALMPAMVRTSTRVGSDSSLGQDHQAPSPTRREIPNPT
jgi:hypothetical protein